VAFGSFPIRWFWRLSLFLSDLGHDPNGTWYLWGLILGDVFLRWFPYGELQTRISAWRWYADFVGGSQPEHVCLRPIWPKPWFWGSRSRPLASSLRDLGREPSYIRHQMRNRTRAHSHGIPNNEHEQLMVRECSAFQLPFERWQLFDRSCEYAEPNTMSIFSAQRLFQNLEDISFGSTYVSRRSSARLTWLTFDFGMDTLDSIRKCMSSWSSVIGKWCTTLAKCFGPFTYPGV
jgi:hypothetical protein